MELSWLFEKLRDAFYAEKLLDSCSKIEFFGRLANAANRCLQQPTKSTANQLYASVLHEAFEIYKEMKKEEFVSLSIALGPEIVDDGLNESLKTGFSPAHLANDLAEISNATSRLLIGLLDQTVFNGYVATEKITSYGQLASLSTSFDFVVIDPPAGMLGIQEGRFASRTRKHWASIKDATSHLNPKGMAIAALVDTAFWSKEWQQFVASLNANEVYLIAVIRFSYLFHPTISLPLTLGIFSRERREKLFVAEVDVSTSTRVLAEAIVKEEYCQAITDGLGIPRANFRGIDQLKVEIEIRGLETQYKEYKHLRLVPDITSPENISLCKHGATYTDEINTIYIPRVGNSPVITSLGQATLKHHNYIQVIITSQEVINEYLAIYFRSHLGQLSLKALHQGLTIKHLPKAGLETISVPVPDIVHQKLIIEAHTKMIKLDTVLEEFRKELSLNPHSASSFIEHANVMLQEVNMLSKVDQILALVRDGESRTLEFKETLSLDISKGTKEKYIEKMVLKTIAAFLNSVGGTLLIGVSDDGDIKGLRKEMELFFKKSKDNLLKHFKDIIRQSIGQTFYPLLDYDMVEVNDEPILRVDCRRSDKECFLDSNEFYVRINPATDRLEGQTMVDYIKRHFKQ